MKARPLEERYDAFVKDAQELLESAGLAGPDQAPKIVGRAILDAFNKLATIHFPEDKEVGGHGPRGLIWDMWGVFDRKSDNVSGSLAIAEVIKNIIKYRPQLDIESQKEMHETKREIAAVVRQSPFFEESRSYRVVDKLVFMLMPFREEWSDRIWNDHIRVFLGNVPGVGKLAVRRADDMFGQGVMEDVFEGIVTAGLIIADCTGRNPNVLYELGIAHALGKRTALLSQSQSDIPFDLRRFRFCIYRDNSSGYPKLERFIQKTIREMFGGNREKLANQGLHRRETRALERR